MKRLTYYVIYTLAFCVGVCAGGLHSASALDLDHQFSGKVSKEDALSYVRLGKASVAELLTAKCGFSFESHPAESIEVLGYLEELKRLETELQSTGYNTTISTGDIVTTVRGIRGIIQDIMDSTGRCRGAIDGGCVAHQPCGGGENCNRQGASGGCNCHGVD